MSKKSLIAIALLIILLAGGSYYWFIIRTPSQQTTDNNGTTPGFNPFDRNTVNPAINQQVSTTTTQNQNNNDQTPVTIPTLRELSVTPIGGMSASSTPTDTVVRFIDRGAGHVFEAYGSTTAITEISNTTLPRIYESYWNKNLDKAVLRYIKEGTDTVVNFYAEIQPVKSATSSTPYQIKGKFISPDIQEVAVSPKGDQIFTLHNTNGQGLGDISGFDESKKTQILDTPITGWNVEWPEQNTVALTTKGSGLSSGFLYFLNPQTGAFNKILGGITGLSAKVSSDGKNVLFSSTQGQNVTMDLYTIKTGQTQDVIFKTLADKCVWSKLHPNEAYCAVPTSIPAGVYPDDWYKGTIQFVDQIWHLDSSTGEVHLLANPLTTAKQLVDATNLALDPKEDFLYFVNKRDLSLWSLDLNQ